MTALDDIAFLADSKNRIAALEVLTTGSHTRNELQESIGVSRSTINRILDGLVSRGWAVREDDHYRITPLGERVVMGLTTLLETMETEARLRGVVQWLPTDEPGFDIELLSGAMITESEPSSPYRAISRLLELTEESETETVRVFGTRPPPGYFDTLDWQVREGMDVEVIFSPVVVDAIRQSPPAGTIESLVSERLTFLVHDDLPCGLTLLDGHLALCGYDSGTGILRAVVDTDDPAALEWANELYKSYRRESRPVDSAAFTE